MNAKYLIIASLVLAILTIGAVSASEDVTVDDAMATSDVTEDPIEEAPVDEVIGQSEDSEPLEDISPSDFNVKIKDSIDLDDEDQNVINYTAPEDAEGNVEVYVDYMDWSSHTDYSIEPGNNYTVSLYQLNINKADTYHIEVKYVPYEGDSITLAQKSLKVTETYDADDFNPSWANWVYDKFDDVFSIYSPTVGTLIVYVNEDKRFNATVDEYDSISVELSDLNITSNAVYAVSAEFIVDSSSQEVDLGQQSVDVNVDNWDADEYVSVYTSANILDSDEEVAEITDYGYINGTVTVDVDGANKLTKVFKDDDEETDFEITVGVLGLYNNITYGTHTVKVVYMKNGVDKHELIRSVEFYVRDDYVRISSDVDVLSHYDNVVYVEDMDDYLNGTLSVYIDGGLKFTKNFVASEEKYDFEVTVDDLKIYNSLFGTHNVKAVFMKNGVEKHELERPVEFTVTPDFVYSESLSVGEKETLVINYLKSFTGTATLYNAHGDGGDLVKGTVAGSAKFSNGVATIPFGSLSKGAHYFLVNITGYPYEQTVEVYVSENTPGLSASVSASEITVGSPVVVKFNSPASTNQVYIDVDGNRYASVIASGAVSQEIKGLTAGTHKIKVFFEDEGKFYSNTFYVTVKNPTPAKKDTIKLALKKVKVKKSAKKLVLQATLKINGKAVKGKVIKFKFNKKSYKAKTNKKGVATVKIKKNLIKKLKKGKKYTVKVTYAIKQKFGVNKITVTDRVKCYVKIKK